jgi:hypothetical protein
VGVFDPKHEIARFAAGNRVLTPHTPKHTARSSFSDRRPGQQRLLVIPQTETELGENEIG